MIRELLIILILSIISYPVFSQPTTDGEPKSEIYFKFYNDSLEYRLNEHGTPFFSFELYRDSIYKDIITYKSFDDSFYYFGHFTCWIPNNYRLIITKKTKSEPEIMVINFNNIPDSRHMCLIINFQSGTYVINEFITQRFIKLYNGFYLTDITPFSWSEIKEN